MKLSTHRRHQAHRLASMRGARFGLLRIRPGDVLVVMVGEMHLSYEQAQRLKDYVSREAQVREVMVLDKGVELGVLRRGVRP